MGRKPAVEETFRIADSRTAEHRQQGMGQLRQRGDIDIEHGLHLCPRGGLERAVVAQAGVIDEEIDVDALVRQPAGEAIDGAGIRKVQA